MPGYYLYKIHSILTVIFIHFSLCYRDIMYGPYYKQMQSSEHWTAYKCIFYKSVKALSKF